MTDYTDKQIIENNKKGKDEYGYMWGAEAVSLSKNDIYALLEGKCVALTINDEYVLFLDLEQNDNECQVNQDFINSLKEDYEND